MDGWEAFECEGHGYYWELYGPGHVFVDTIEPADGRGYVGRNECIDRAVLERGGPVIGGPTVTFHTFTDWLRTPASEGGGMEPWCNHDAVAVVNGVCECGARV